MQENRSQAKQKIYKKNNSLVLMLAVNILSILFTAYSFGQKQSPDFQYLEFTEDNTLITTHDIKFSLEIPAGFKKIKSLNHKPEFNGHPFNVSTAALVKGNRILMIHAETVTDSSGFLEYSYMEPAKLSGFDFFMQEKCIKITDEILDEAADIKYFQNNGFDFQPGVFMRQYFVNSPDGNSEFVLSYTERISDCSDSIITVQFKKEFDRRLKETIILSSRKNKK